MSVTSKAGMKRPARAQFFKINFVLDIGVCVRVGVCPEAMNNKWYDVV